MIHMSRLLCSMACLASGWLLTGEPVLADDWTSFRGNDSSGISGDAGLPLQLSDSRNLAWKVELPGRGPSSPIVVGDRVFVTCSGGPAEDQLYLVCFDRHHGAKLWQRRFQATGRSHCHPLSANAAPTPCSDGDSIFALFSSNDLVCTDLDGNLKWFRGLAIDHPKAGHDTGMSSSPAVHGNIVVCQVENQGDSFATALDTRTGETVWEIPRPADASWASPVIFTSGPGQRACCLLTSGDRATVVALETGETLWEKTGRGNPIPSASVSQGRLLLPLDGTTLVEVDDQGKFSETWSSSRLAAGSASSLLDDNRVYAIGRGGILGCFNALDGERIWQTRVGGQHWTTPLVAGSHAYMFAQDGTVSVISLADSVGDDSRLVHSHRFEGEVFLGSPAVSDGAIYMRSDRYLYKFARDPA